MYLNLNLTSCHFMLKFRHMNFILKATLVAFTCFLLWPFSTLAQRRERPIKPTLLVYGSDVEAFATALQSAKSSVPTIWVLDGGSFVSSLTTQEISIRTDIHVDGGIWKELLAAIANPRAIGNAVAPSLPSAIEMPLARQPVLSDSVAIRTKARIPAQIAENELRNLLSKQPNLIVLENGKIEKLTRTKRGWNVVLSNRAKYELRALVDASSDQALLQMSGVDAQALRPNSIAKTANLTPELSRTVVAIGEANGGVYGFTLHDLLKEQEDGVFSMKSLDQFDQSANSIPLRMSYAQAIGAAAAYVAFFRTTADHIEVRKLQGELLTYGARLVPYTDVRVEDVHFDAIQKSYLTGIFDNKGDQFRAVDSVRFDEIQPVLNRLFSRSQLWFVENEGEYLTLGDVISLVKFLGMKGNEVDRQIENNWTTKLGFQEAFDLSRLASREEFVVLLELYANPFTVRVTREGVIQR